MHITVELETLLKDRGVTLYEFCKVADISYQQGSDIVKKRTKSISFEVLEKLCTYLNCRVDEVLSLEGNSEGYIAYILRDFPETENVQRVPKSKVNDRPKPFLQWVGGKREMIPQYEAYFPESYSRYWEPFLGGGALFFHLNPAEAIVNDINPELIKTYEGVRDNPEKVIDLLQQLRRKHSKELYMAIRSIDRKVNILNDFSDYEVAARMIYLNQTCFNGVYRVNKLGQFNVPIGSSLNRVICDPIAIRKASELLRKATIKSEDFEKHIEEASKGDFIYLDPPYEPISEYSDFTRYTKEKFYKHDQVRLAEIFKRLHEKGCYVMLSNSNAAFIRELYSDFNILEVYSGRNLNSKSDRRGRVIELLVTNY
ncbi:Dam family site-specific DNA-(adenine-N6)-methyltransferase [Candidatus Saccharibacteria bacterium]|nr:Dam family site-specific DNA-(adenine-N6)-methyltransferase [Candidatus Saccharibacteria bacterium]